MKDMRLPSRAVGVLALLISLLVVLGCVLLIGPYNTVKIVFLVVAVTVPLVAGSYFVYKYLRNKRIAGTLAASAVFGFVFFEAAMLSMLLDPKGSKMSIWSALGFAAVAGIAAFAFSLVVSAVYPWLLGKIRRQR